MAALSWWKIAVSWQERSRNISRGQVEPQLTIMADALGVTMMTVRRAASALRFAEQLVQKGRIRMPQDLQHLGVTYMMTLQRIDRLDPEKVDRMLPELINGSLSGKSLLEIEVSMREDKLAVLASSGVDRHLLRMNSKNWRMKAIDLLVSPACPVQGKLVRPRTASLPSPLVLDAMLLDGEGKKSIIHGFRVFTGVTGREHSRYLGYAVLLGLAGARILDSFYLIFQEHRAASDVTKLLRSWGDLNIGVIWISKNWELNIESEARLQAKIDPTLAPIRNALMKSLKAN